MCDERAAGAKLLSKQRSRENGETGINRKAVFPDSPGSPLEDPAVVEAADIPAGAGPGLPGALARDIAGFPDSRENPAPRAASLIAAVIPSI
jgi:hypothetical protein